MTMLGKLMVMKKFKTENRKVQNRKQQIMWSEQPITSYSSYIKGWCYFTVYRDFT